MPITLATRGATATVALQDFLDEVTSKLDRNNVVESLTEIAFSFEGLAKNAGLLADRFSHRIESMLGENERIPYTPQSVMLGSGPGFYVRANIWTPLRLQGTFRTREERAFSYRLAHDHNFSFLTIGYFGSGYETDLYAYDQSTVAGFVGERVSLVPLGRERLTKGKLMIYEEKKDVHIQFPPEELSISLNVMVNLAHSADTSQYIFDVETGTISELPAAATIYRRSSFLELAASVGDNRTFAALAELASGCESSSVRCAAVRACMQMRQIAAADKQLVLGAALADGSRDVREVATSGL